MSRITQHFGLVVFRECGGEVDGYDGVSDPLFGSSFTDNELPLFNERRREARSLSLSSSAGVESEDIKFFGISRVWKLSLAALP